MFLGLPVEEVDCLQYPRIRVWSQDAIIWVSISAYVCASKMILGQLLPSVSNINTFLFCPKICYKILSQQAVLTSKKNFLKQKMKIM